MGNAQPDEASDLELFSRTSRGDESAFVQIVERYKDGLYSFLRRFVSDGVDAEDLLQQTFLRVYRKSLDHCRIQSFSSWIYTVAANLARDELRRRARVASRTLQLEEQEVDSTPDRVTTPAENLAQSELRARIDSAVASLDEIHRMVFILRDIEGMSYEEIARILNVRVGTVKSRLNRARMKLKEILAPYLQGGF